MRFVGLDPEEFRSDPASFEEDGAPVASRAVTEAVARRAAGRDSVAF